MSEEEALLNAEGARSTPSREARKQQLLLARLALEEEQRVRARVRQFACPLQHFLSRAAAAPDVSSAPLCTRAVRARCAAQLKQRIRAALKRDGPLGPDEEALLAAHPEAAAEERAALERGREKKLRDEERRQEVEDSEQEVKVKVAELVKLLKASKHVVVYTGAGLSTAAQIPDYRGPQGVWTLQKKGEQASMPIEYEETRPTAAHMALRALVKGKRVRHVVSQNVDGLHLRSGLPPSSLTELHGNIYIEQCVGCGKRYLRPFHVTESSSYHRHETARTCAAKACKGKGACLRDTIVYFGEKLHPGDLERARAEAEKADLAIFLGSSLKVLQHYKFIWERPRGRQKRFVIVNLQWTVKDRIADLKIHGRCDSVLAKLLAALKLKVPAYAEKDDPIAALAAKAAAAKPAGRSATPGAPATGRRAPKSRAFPSVVRRAEEEEEAAAGTQVDELDGSPPGPRKRQKR